MITTRHLAAFITPAPANTISPSGIASGETFGTAKITLFIAPTGIASLEAFGTPAVFASIHPAGISSTEVFGTPQLNQKLHLSMVYETDDFSAALGAGWIVTAIGPGGADFYAQTGELHNKHFPDTLITGACALRTETYDNDQFARFTFGNVNINSMYPGPCVRASRIGGIFIGYVFRTKRNDADPGHRSLEIVKGHISGAQQAWTSLAETAQGIAWANGDRLEIKAVGTTITAFVNGSVVLTATDSDIASGAPGIAQAVNNTIDDFLFDNFVGGTVASGTIDGSGIPSGQAFGTPKLILTISPVAVASAEAFGSPKLNFTIYPGPVPSSETFGTPKVNLVLYTVPVSSGETFGIPQLNLIIFPDGTISGEVFGSITVVKGNALVPLGISSDEAFGLAVVAVPVLGDTLNMWPLTREEFLAILDMLNQGIA